MSKKLLQITLLILGAIPLSAGILTLLQGVHATVRSQTLDGGQA